MPVNNPKLPGILQASSFEVIPGLFRYCKVSERPQDRHFAVIEDEEEITVVTDHWESLKTIEQNEHDYALIALHVSVPFYSVGFLAAVGEGLASEDMNILFLSTFTNDYVLIRQERLEDALRVLKKLGLSAMNKA